MNTPLLNGALLSAFWLHQASAGGADPRLEAQVRSALYRDLGSSARDIRVHSYGGTVQLTGFVASRSLWIEAQDAATKVDGVNHVLNVIQRGGERSIQ